MDVHLLFGMSALLSLVSSAVLAALYLWPFLRGMDRERALAVLVAPHMFWRFMAELFGAGSGFSFVAGRLRGSRGIW